MGYLCRLFPVSGRSRKTGCSQMQNNAAMIESRLVKCSEKKISPQVAAWEKLQSDSWENLNNSVEEERLFIYF